MANFSAEAGRIYYFRARLFSGHSGDYSFALDPVNSDEAKYLMATSAFSVSHPKKWAGGAAFPVIWLGRVIPN